MTIHIATATQPEHYVAARMLFTQYAETLGLDLAYQGFAEELEQLTTIYQAPQGALLLACNGNDAVGTVGLRRFDDSTAEMKRLFVQPEWQGRGTGRMLGAALIKQARQRGYRTIVLDSRRSMPAALHLYSALGFAEIPAYCFNPYPDAVFMRRALE